MQNIFFKGIEVDIAGIQKSEETIAYFQWFLRRPSPLNVFGRSDHCHQWFYDGFLMLLPLLSMVFDGSGPLVKRCDGFDGSLWSRWPLIRTDEEINLSPQFTQVFLTTHNLSLSQTISYLGLIWTTQLSIGMTSLVVFNDCYNVHMLSLSQCLSGHNNIKSPLLVFVLKVTTSFRNT